MTNLLLNIIAGKESLPLPTPYLHVNDVMYSLSVVSGKPIDIQTANTQKYIYI